MIEIQPVAVEAAIAHSAAIHNAAHLLSCTDYLLQALPEEVQDLPVLADLSVLLGKIDAEIIAARVKWETVTLQDSAARVAPWRNFERLDTEIRERAVKQDAGKQASNEALNELRDALILQTILIRQLADNAGIEDINTEHEATRPAKDLYATIDRAFELLDKSAPTASGNSI